MNQVAVVQLVSGTDWQHNLERAGDWIAKAAAAGARLVLLPENFAVFDASALLERGREEVSTEGPSVYNRAGTYPSDLDCSGIAAGAQ